MANNLIMGVSSVPWVGFLISYWWLCSLRDIQRKMHIMGEFFDAVGCPDPNIYKIDIPGVNMWIPHARLTVLLSLATGCLMMLLMTTLILRQDNIWLIILTSVVAAGTVSLFRSLFRRYCATLVIFSEHLENYTKMSVDFYRGIE